MKAKTLLIPLLLLLLALAAAGCAKTDTSGVTPGEYKNLTVEKAEREPAEEDVDAAIASTLAAYTVYPQITDRAVQDGDIVDIDYRGLLDGEPFEGGTAEGTSLTIGSGRFIPGFEEQLIGAMPGEQTDLNVTFPEDYHATELAGKAVVFEVTVNSIRGEGEPTVPELTDEWAAANTEFATAADYRADVRASLAAQMAEAADAQEWNALITQIIDNATFADIPAETIDEETEARRRYYTEYAQSYGMTLEDFTAGSGMTAEGFETELRTMAEAYIKQNLLLLKIAEIEKLSLSAEEKDSYSQAYGYTDFANFAQSYDPAVITEMLLADKVIDFLKANNTFA